MNSDAMAAEEDRTPITVARRVFVGNLSWRTSWQDLKDYFRECGNVVHTDVMRDPDTGRSKGSGIVEFSDVTEAVAAIEKMNDTTLDGRLIFVREDREDKELKQSKLNNEARQVMHPKPSKTPNRPTNGSKEVAGAQKAHTQGKRVFAMNLDYKTTWRGLKDHFKQAGSVAYAEILRDAHTDRSKGAGIVEFESADDALNAINVMTNTELDGRSILVREDREEKSKA